MAKQMATKKELKAEVKQLKEYCKQLKYINDCQSKTIFSKKEHIDLLISRLDEINEISK